MARMSLSLAFPMASRFLLRNSHLPKKSMSMIGCKLRLGMFFLLMGNPQLKYPSRDKMNLFQSSNNREHMLYLIRKDWHLNMILVVILKAYNCIHHNKALKLSRMFRMPLHCWAQLDLGLNLPLMHKNQ